MLDKMNVKHNFKKLTIWNDAIELATDVYGITKFFPKEEKFGLALQLNRAAVSISSNIAEGAGRNNVNEFKHFLGIAYGSLNEVYTQLLISNRIKLVDQSTFNKMEDKIDKIQKSIFKFSNSIK